jgi:hypothetical protein
MRENDQGYPLTIGGGPGQESGVLEVLSTLQLGRGPHFSTDWLTDLQVIESRRS